MQHKSGVRRPPGRPRSEAARQAILQSTLKLLRDTGFEGLTMEAVAAEANVGKATLYRWWPNKAALVVDAFAESANEELRFPDTGSVLEDMERQMVHVVRIFLSTRGKIVSCLIGGGQSDPELISAFRERFLKPRREEAYATLRRGLDRNELRSDADLDLLLDSLYGPIYMRFLIGHLELSIEFVKKLCRAVMRSYLVR
jgi:AcrR family transcriptional regulator